MSDDNESKGRPLIGTRRIDAGLLQVVVLAVGVIVYVVNSNFKSEDANNKIVELKAQLADVRTSVTAQIVEGRSSVTAQLADLKLETNTRLNSIQQQTNTMPDIVARLAQLERRADMADKERSAQDARIVVIDQRSIKSASDVENLRLGSGQRLGR